MVHHGKNMQVSVRRCNGSLSHLIFLVPRNALATEAERTTSEQCAPPVPCQLFTEICQQFAKDGSCNKTWVSGSWLLQSTCWKSCIKFFSPVGTLLYVLLNFPWDLQRAGRFLLADSWWLCDDFTDSLWAADSHVHSCGWCTHEALQNSGSLSSHVVEDDGSLGLGSTTTLEVRSWDSCYKETSCECYSGRTETHKPTIRVARSVFEIEQQAKG